MDNTAPSFPECVKCILPTAEVISFQKSCNRNKSFSHTEQHLQQAN